MKIKRGRLQQIIQEELKRVLKEERNEPYMVVARDLRGELVFHDASGRPNNLNPKIYDNKDDADQFAINQTSKAKTAGSPPLYAVPVARVLRQIDDHPQRRVITDLIDDFMNKPAVSDNDLDTDNDGMISVGELEKELQDIRDDLVDPEIEGVIAAANAAGAKSWKSLEKKVLSGAIDDENTVDLDDLDALAKAFKVSKTINHETEDASGTIEIGTINGKPIASWNVMGNTTWIR